MFCLLMEQGRHVEQRRVRDRLGSWQTIKAEGKARGGKTGFLIGLNVILHELKRNRSCCEPVQVE